MVLLFVSASEVSCLVVDGQVGDGAVSFHQLPSEGIAEILELYEPRGDDC